MGLNMCGNMCARLQACLGILKDTNDMGIKKLTPNMVYDLEQIAKTVVLWDNEQQKALSPDVRTSSVRGLITRGLIEPVPSGGAHPRLMLTKNGERVFFGRAKS